jgi:hypothetical protein
MSLLLRAYGSHSKPAGGGFSCAPGKRRNIVTEAPTQRWKYRIFQAIFPA